MWWRCTVGVEGCRLCEHTLCAHCSVISSSLSPSLISPLLRPKQHHRHHCLHLQQRGRPQRQEGRGKEEPVQLWLVLLLRRALLHRGWIGGRSRSQHIHREKQRDTLSRPSWLHQKHLLFFTLFSHPELPLPKEALTLQFEVNWPIPRALPSGDEDRRRKWWWRRFGDGFADGGYIPLHPQ